MLRCFVNLAMETKDGVKEDHPALAYPDKASAFQAAMMEMAKGAQSEIIDAIARAQKADKEK